jgi:hypothetical protein
MRHDQPPPYRSLADAVLMVILRGKYVVLSNGNFMSTRLTAIYTGPRSHRSGIVELVKRCVVALLHELGIFVQCHRKSRVFLEPEVPVARSIS